MNDVKKQVENLVDELKQERDEIRVKLQLGKMEASDEWNKLQIKLDQLEVKAKEVSDATAESAKEVGAAAKLLGEELRKGFRNVAKHLK